MKNKFLYTLTFFLTILSAHTSHALIEANVFGGFSFINATSLDNYLKAVNEPGIPILGIYGAEGTFFIPTTSLGLGVRTDFHGIKVTNQGDEFTVAVNRISGVLKYRLLDTVIYFGPVGFVGISHSPKVTVKQGSNTTIYDSGNSQSGGLGIEAGLKLAIIKLGFELGWESYLVRDLKGASGNASFDLNFNGFYILGAVGLVF